MPKSKIVLLLAWSLTIHSGFCGFTEKVAQQHGNVLTDFFAYRHITIVHFDVPENSVAAIFKFTVKEQKTGGIGRCNPRDVSMHLKSGSIPFVIPDNASIKAKLLGGRRTMYDMDVQSNGDEHITRIDAPPPGDWFLIAFRPWFEPESGRIMQEGLHASCDTVLDADMSIETADSLLILSSNKEQATKLSHTDDSAVMQFYVPKNVERTTINVTSSCGEDCNVALHVTTKEHLLGEMVNSSVSSLTFRPHENSIHYVILRLHSGNETDVRIVLEHQLPSTNVTREKVIRKSLANFFLFDYNHVAENGTEVDEINLHAENVTIMRFTVDPISDVGGTMSVGVKLSDETSSQNGKVMVVGCMNLGYFANISKYGSCIRENANGSPDVVVKNPKDPAFVHVPYPEPGVWYLSIKAFCLPEKEECPCAETCATNSSCVTCECMTECSAVIKTSISSSPCIGAKNTCSDRGKCLNYMGGGFVFSSCFCHGRYRGFDCSDDTYVYSNSKILLRQLLLTLSNLAFFGAIYIAITRRYYTEAIVYFAVMFFSTFYHACEAGEEIHDFCILQLSVLQFGDFFNALLAIWVTLVAMASLSRHVTAALQMTGVVILAIGAEMDRTALWVFLLPAVSGCLLVVITWGIRCRQKGTLKYPARRYRIIYLPAGLLVVSFGLVCYAFLQTRKNYYAVHSIWHMCVAVAAVLLLPRREDMA